MKIYFLRHTTLDIDDDIFYGQTDVDVSANFLKEVSVIKKMSMHLIIKITKINKCFNVKQIQSILLLYNKIL